MKTNAEITVILDRSGSMKTVLEPTIAGFNTFLKEQKKGPGIARITLHQFDHEFESPILDKDVGEAKPLDTTTYVPRGSTALLDAIGRGIVDTGARLEAKPEAERPDHVIFVIVTDGLENASKEYSREKIFEMIEHQTKKYKWQFVFLGANQDAIAVGGQMGILRAQSMSVGNSAGEVGAMYAATADNVSKLRRMAGGQSMPAYDDDQRRRAKNK